MKIQYLFILAIFWMSCHKDTDQSSTAITTTFTTPKIYQEITGTVIGYVYDEQNQPIQGANVSIYSKSTTTNQHGVFVLKNSLLDQQGTYIKVEKNGYILGSDLVYPVKGNTSYSYVKMMALETSKTVDSKSGGTVNITGGGTIDFPSNGFKKVDGSTYEGNVFVTAKFLSPNDSQLADVMPGGLIADAANGNTVVLATLGMVAVELRGTSGEKLNLASNKKATIKIPALTSNRPDEIPLWYFDENKGRWQEEGKANLVGDQYVGEVSHFSFWNCDAPFPLVQLCGKVYYQNGTSSVNISVAVKVEGLGTMYGRTGEEGSFCGHVPKGKKLLLRVFYYECDLEFVEFEIGPFDDNVILDDIFIPDVKILKFSGRMTCNNIPVNNGIIVFKGVENFTRIFYTEDGGAFDIFLPNLTCNNIPTMEVFGFDAVTNNSSQKFTYDITEDLIVEDLVLEVCDDACEFELQLFFECIGGSNDEAIQKIYYEVQGGSGNFAHIWDNQSTEDTLYLPYSADEICIDIIDVGLNCTKTFCNFRITSENDGMYNNLEGPCQVTTIGWCGDTITNNIIFQKVAPNSYVFYDISAEDIDFSLGAYVACYVPNPTLPGGDLAFNINCGKVSYSGKSRWGETYHVNSITVNGSTMILDWRNDYDPESGVSTITRTDGKTWPALFK